MYPAKYNKNLEREFYANMLANIEVPHGPYFVYVRGSVIAFTSANIAHFLSCPHYKDI